MFGGQQYSLFDSLGKYLELPLEGYWLGGRWILMARPARSD
jgi:hypothetical protein